MSSTKHNDIALCTVDVTWGMSAANKNLVAVCLMANKEDGSQTVAPVAYGLLSSAESECTASSTMLAIRRAIKRLWDIDFTCKVGTVSDHSSALLNALKYNFPYVRHGNCWMHLKMKFWPNCPDRKIIKNYVHLLRKHATCPSWLYSIASLDINLLDTVPNVEAFREMWRLIKAVWVGDGEKVLADHVAEQYTENDDWMLLFSNSFGIEQFRPNQQALDVL